MIFCDIETLNTDRAVPHAKCIYRLDKISGQYNRDITEQKHEKCQKKCVFLKD